ncbi:MAG: quinoprotein dehydrogenase-associated probable transporter substrate-binding protein [Betaproteobacteria bacterium]|nr:quinoprotein dehydrogenase-associated probable transporter substrate-binding protein [Betaproteobacteria bacterium]
MTGQRSRNLYIRLGRAVILFSLLAFNITICSAAEHRADVKPALRVCAAPNNLPFSNSKGEGFENALARLIARDLKRPVSYTWWPGRGSSLHNASRAASCDIVMGIPPDYKFVRPTLPYYRSTYAFVTRRDGGAPIDTLDDPRLKHLRIGIHVTGGDYDHMQLAQALAARRIVDNLRGYAIYGDYSDPNPPRTLIDAVAVNEIDVAIAWGPIAGYFAHRQAVALDVTPMRATREAVPMTFDIAIGVRRGDPSLASELDAVLLRRSREIQRLLDGYHVPQVTRPRMLAKLDD